MNTRARADPRLGDVLLLVVAVAGLAMCITLVYEAMRSVMDVGGACADGGPYVSAQPCPDGSPAAMLLGIFGLFGFGGLGMVFGAKVGGYGWVPLLAWTGLFAALGWNFLDYGLLNPPPGEPVEWGYVIPGVLFQLMAWVPVAVVVMGLWAVRGSSRGSAFGPITGSGFASDAAPITANMLRGPGQPAQAPVTVIDMRPPPVPGGHRVEVAGPVREGPAAGDRRALRLRGGRGRGGCRRADPGRSAATGRRRRGRPTCHGSGRAAAPAEFQEGTQALLDRLERLADMRDRGLLTSAEYETAKEAVMHEIEARS